MRDEVGRATSEARRLATPPEVAAYLQVPVRTLYTWRYQRKGPRAHRVGRHLRYRWEDVEAWLASAAASR
jgi:excisionase family DNA binding protein